MTSTDDETLEPPNRLALLLLRILAVGTGLLALTQAVLAVLFMAGVDQVFPVHASIGLITMIVAVFAGAASVWWQRISGNTGLMMHALAVSVLSIVQYGLGEGGVRIAHIIIGVLFLVAAIALGTLSLRPAGTSARRRRA